MDITNCINNGRVLDLARQSEFGNTFSYDFSAWVEQYGEGSLGWLFRRPGETDAYLLPSVTEGNVSTATFTATETEKDGLGQLEVFYINTGQTQKRVSASLGVQIPATMQATGAVPSPWESYIDAVHEDAVAAEEARQAIENMTATASVGDTYGEPSVEVEKTIVDDHVNLDFDFQNLRGNGIESVSLLSTSGLSKTYRITFSDGSHFDYSLADGNGIASAVLNADYTLTLTFTDGTSYTTPSIRGEKGEKGDTGNVYFASFEINPLTGILSMYTDTGYSGANFALNNGYLEVTV